jgi:DNA-binding transcriptional ArsR family regulator
MYFDRRSFLLLLCGGEERLVVSVVPNISRIAGLIGEPSRAAILTALLDGRALPATELARAAGVGATGASDHLAKLVGAKLLEVEVEGRHRYYRLARSDVAAVIEDLAHLAGVPAGVSLVKVSPSAQALRLARSCYDHLAGEFAVAIAGALEERHYLVRGEGKRYEIGGREARRWFGKQGVDFDSLKPGRWGLARQCLDWTERRPHLAGPLGASLFAIWKEAGWLRRDREEPRLVRVTESGREQFRRRLGISINHSTDGAG